MASVVIAGDVSGTCTLQAANAAGTTVLNLPTTSGTLVSTGDSPSFANISATNVTASANSNATTFNGTTLVAPTHRSAANLTFQTNGTTTAMTIDTSQNVGIGTTSPTRILDIAAPNPGGGGGLRVTATTGTNGALMQVSNTGGNLYYAIDTSAGGTFGSGYSANIWYDGNYPMRFATANQVQMAITGAGLFQMNSGYGSVATAYGCRAWVNFNGTGTVAIRGSGNVSSITDNGTGDYTVNFTTAMPDANYAIAGAAGTNSGSNAGTPVQPVANFYNAGSVRVLIGNASTSFDREVVCVNVFR